MWILHGGELPVDLIKSIPRLGRMAHRKNLSPHKTGPPLDSEPRPRFAIAPIADVQIQLFSSYTGRISTVAPIDSNSLA